MNIAGGNKHEFEGLIIESVSLFDLSVLYNAGTAVPLIMV
jgi:hypothetical protein